MANMRQKSPDRRNARRRRFINVVDLIRKAHNCTAVECFGVVQTIHRENARLAEEVRRLTVENAELKEIIDRLKLEKTMGLVD